MDEILSQILTELKDIKSNQAASEREIRKNRESLVNLEIARVADDKNRVVLEQGVNRINEKLSSIEHRILKIEVVQESEIVPNINLLEKQTGSYHCR